MPLGTVPTVHITPLGAAMISKPHIENGLTCWCQPRAEMRAEGNYVLHNVLVEGPWWDAAREALATVEDACH